jgi:single-stranded-DNA-specific exonuclease
MLLEKYEIFQPDEKKLKNLEKKYSPFLAKLLLARKIETEKEAEEFLNISWDNILDPFLFRDMQKAVDRIFQAIDKSQKIVIFSDYDADGIPGAVALHDFFKKIKYTNFENYIPDRNKEGFGLNSQVVKKFQEEGVDLVITIDCGIADIFEAEELKKAGIDLIITAHHKEGEKLPEALAILDHQVDGETYPEKVLSGAGVVFTLIQALLLEGSTRKIPNFLIIPEG